MKQAGAAPVTPRNLGGRPRVAEPLSPVTIRLPARTHDRLIEMARREDLSVSALARRIVVVQLE